MDTTHFDWFFVTAAAGLGLLLAAGANFVFGRKGQWVWLRGLATVAVCGGIFAVLTLAVPTKLAACAVGVLALVLVAGFLAGSDWFARQLASLATFLRKPGVRWGVVALAGIAVILGSGVAFDLADQAVVDQTMRNLNYDMGRAKSRPADGTHAATDRGSQVVVKEPVEARDAGVLKASEEKALRDSQKSDQVIRRSAATDLSNCHGWVFTGGKYILSGDDVELILKDNGYHEIHDPHPGDLVVYRQGGSISHTAVVRYVTEGQPVLVEGKWGTMGVFLHQADKSSYGTDYAFYRSARQGHLLVGLGGSPGPVGAVPAAAE